jgi:hypothetical protein
MKMEITFSSAEIFEALQLLVEKRKLNIELLKPSTMLEVMPLSAMLAEDERP